MDMNKQLALLGAQLICLVAAVEMTLRWLERL